MFKTALLCLLVACPVGPEDVTTLDEDNPITGQQMGANPQEGMGPGSPPPQHQAGNTQQNKAGQGGMEGMQSQGAKEQGGQANGGDASMNGPAKGAEPSEMQAELGVPQTGEATLAAAPPTTPQDVMPMYSKAPSFDEIIGEKGESITLQINVEGAENYNLEFIKSQEIGGRVAPKVLHMERSFLPKTSIQAPKSYDDPVWLVVTADLKDDGPSEDDLIGGTTSPITLGTEDMELTISLNPDESWMENLPWYTKAGEVDAPTGE